MDGTRLKPREFPERRGEWCAIPSRRARMRRGVGSTVLDPQFVAPWIWGFEAVCVVIILSGHMASVEHVYLATAGPGWVSHCVTRVASGAMEVATLCTRFIWTTVHHRSRMTCPAWTYTSVNVYVLMVMSKGVNSRRVVAAWSLHSRATSIRALPGFVLDGADPALTRAASLDRRGVG